jgi:hypothetical protein
VLFSVSLYNQLVLLTSSGLAQAVKHLSCNKEVPLSDLDRDKECSYRDFPLIVYIQINLFDHLDVQREKKNSVVLVCKRTIPTERPPLVGEVSTNFSEQRVSRGQGNESPWPLISVF